MKKMTLVVRKAIESDIPQIQALSREAFRIYAERAGITEHVSPLAETYEDLKKELENKLVFVALSDDTVMGSVRVVLNSDKTAYLSRLGVIGTFQSEGIGTILMNAVDNEMRKSGVTNLYLHTASRMLSLVRFYYGRGFYIESTTRDRGYIRALLCKEYKIEAAEDSISFKEEIFGAM